MGSPPFLTKGGRCNKTNVTIDIIVSENEYKIINNNVIKREVPSYTNRTPTHTHIHIYIYIYIYMVPEFKRNWNSKSTIISKLIELFVIFKLYIYCEVRLG